MNDLPGNVRCSKICLYADDTNFLNVARSESLLREKAAANLSHGL